MKLLKKLFANKAFLTLLAVALQIGFYFLLNSIVESALGYIPGTVGNVRVSQIVVSSVNILVSLVVIVRLVVRNMTPDAKVSWITLLVFAPITGALLYVFFSHNRLSRRKERLYLSVHEREKKYMTAENDFADVLGEYIGHSRYLYEKAKAVPHRYSSAEFYPTGELFFDALVQELEKAEKYILMEYFIIERGVMWDTVEKILIRKAQSGVAVKLMYDDIGSLPHIERDFYKKMRKEGIDCVRFNKFTPVMTATHNNRDHRKITVVDGRVGFLGGANLSDEYINVKHPLGQWKDSALKIRGSAVQNLIMLFLTSFDVQEDKRLENYAAYMPDYYEWFGEETGIIQPFGDGPKPIMPDHIAENCILNIINQAKNYIYITTPYLIIDYTLSSALVRAANRGVDVRIVTPRIPDKKLVFWITRRNYKPLVKAGVKIYEYLPGFIHAKNYLSDDTVGMVGTVNMDYRSLLHHFECGVWMYKTACLKDIRADFEQTFAVSELMTEQTIKQSVPRRVASAIGSIFSPLL